VDQVKVGLGLISGGDDPRSGTETFENTFSKKNVRIDTAFAEYTPTNWFSLIGGKFYNPLYRPDDLVWDGDITPEGAAAKLRFQLLPNLDLNFNAASYILDEQSNAKDPYMIAIQPGLLWKINRDTNLQLALAYYYFRNVKGNALASISTVLEMTNGTADLGEADDKLLVAEPRHGCWGVGKS